MGSSPSVRTPAPPPPVVPPAKLEDENARLAVDEERRRLATAKGRRSTKLIGPSEQSPETQELLGFQGTNKTGTN